MSRLFEESLLVFNGLREKQYFGVPIVLTIVVLLAFLSCARDDNSRAQCTPPVSRLFEDPLLIFNDLRTKQYFSVPIVLAMVLPSGFLSAGVGQLSRRGGSEPDLWPGSLPILILRVTGVNSTAVSISGRGARAVGTKSSI